MNTKLKKIAGQQLQLLRLEKNLTQEQMSEKTKIFLQVPTVKLNMVKRI